MIDKRLRQRPSQAVQFPDDQTIAAPQISQTCLEAGPVVSCAAGLVDMEMALVDARCDQGVSLKIDGLPFVGVCGDIPQSGRFIRPS